MKKIAIMLVALVSILTLTACQKEEDIFVHNVPEEGNVYLDTLPYYEYISLNNPLVTITIKDIGEIKVQLFEDLAPNTVLNFIKYIEDNAYEGSTFHRVIADFMIQGGIVETTTCTIEGEFDSNGITNPLSHQRGVISMARTNVKNSASSQFFIVHEDSTFLDGEYAAFGGVVSGFNVIDYIASLQTDAADKPLEDVIITSIEVDLKGNTYSDPVCVD